MCEAVGYYGCGLLDAFWDRLDRGCVREFSGRGSNLGWPFANYLSQALSVVLRLLSRFVYFLGLTITLGTTESVCSSARGYDNWVTLKMAIGPSY